MEVLLTFIYVSYLRRLKPNGDKFFLGQFRRMFRFELSFFFSGLFIFSYLLLIGAAKAARGKEGNGSESSYSQKRKERREAEVGRGQRPSQIEMATKLVKTDDIFLTKISSI